MPHSGDQVRTRAEDRHASGSAPEAPGAPQDEPRDQGASTCKNTREAANQGKERAHARGAAGSPSADEGEPHQKHSHGDEGQGVLEHSHRVVEPRFETEALPAARISGQPRGARASVPRSHDVPARRRHPDRLAAASLGPRPGPGRRPVRHVQRALLLLSQGAAPRLDLALSEGRDRRDTLRPRHPRPADRSGGRSFARPPGYARAGDSRAASPFRLRPPSRPPSPHRRLRALPREGCPPSACRLPNREERASKGPRGDGSCGGVASRSY